jgi:hypothetical protein
MASETATFAEGDRVQLADESAPLFKVKPDRQGTVVAFHRDTKNPLVLWDGLIGVQEWAPMHLRLVDDPIPHQENT